MDPIVKRTYLVFTDKDVTKLVSKAVLNKMFQYDISEANFVLENFKYGEDNIWRPRPLLKGGVYLTGIMKWMR